MNSLAKIQKQMPEGQVYNIKDNIKLFIRRTDLEFSTTGLETCFVELPRTKQKAVIIGCIYRHPHNDRESFLQIIRQKLEYLNNQGFEAYIAGDININFFSYNTDIDRLLIV